uniref:Uncharacterized protein n=2 Tax=Panagrolaimus sp. PS1159 TaxID=55785 RepID=A0AC35ERG8_9BILA
MSLAGLILFHLLSYSWPFLSGNLKTYNDFDYHNANDTELAGCNVDRFDWCYDLKPVNVYLYYISYIILIGTCFPNINISLNTLFSKIIGPRPQGTQQGWLQVAGSSARMIGPVSIR